MIADAVQTFTAPSMFMGKNWCARCVVCKKVVVKYAISEEEARSDAEGTPHNCCAPTQPRCR